ncbi:neurotrophin-3 isoform X1 [Girardinichthys multiradiatus]|uniref:neurotrophin-3 isoform X1 n=2 Tax=Girardinichthys multiradiatus TaxID=208333 RepID=UPI001FAC74E0|nr:neurotrophin-3 isoform X1 [Girardinichthys multiradiatus]
MVTFITILQVNLVMSILLYVMVLVYLYGIQASSMNSSHHGQQSPSPDPLNSLIIQLLQADLTRERIQGNHSQQGRSRDREDALLPLLGPILPFTEQEDAEQWEAGGRSGWSSEVAVEQQVMLVNSDLLRKHKRYISPRVVLSDRPPLQPPPLYLPDDFISGGLEEGATGNNTRMKRQAEHRSYRGEYSVCDSESKWVMDKTNAVDLKGEKVTVMAKIKTIDKKEIKQFFYETKCRDHMSQRNRCRGIDDKNWNSECKTVQTFVRALTQDKSQVGWRWIRINTSCVCALSRKRHRT